VKVAGEEVMQPRSLKLGPLQYEWQQLYLDAVLEAEEKLPEAIEVAIQKITEREKVLLSLNAMDSEELNAICDALTNLRALKRRQT
jgi:hypothetical protein